MRHGKKSFVDLIGNTPLVHLGGRRRRPAAPSSARPSSSIPASRSRTGRRCSSSRTRSRTGLLRPGGTIVEGTAGNTGIGLALVGNAKGYRTVIVIPDTQSQEKKDMIRLCGAELIEVPAVPYRDPNNYVRYSGRLAEALERGAAERRDLGEPVRQCRQPRRPHPRPPGPRSGAQTEGKVDAFVSRGRHRRHARGRRHRAQGAQPGREDRARRPGRRSALQLLCARRARRPRAARSPRASARGGSPRTWRARRSTCGSTSRTRTRCRWSSIWWSRRAWCSAARPGSTSRARSGRRRSWAPATSS